MKISKLKELIKEAVREVVKEELPAILAESRAPSRSPAEYKKMLGLNEGSQNHYSDVGKKSTVETDMPMDQILDQFVHNPSPGPENEILTRSAAAADEYVAKITGE